MPAPLFVFFALSTLFVDLAISLFKKLNTGDFSSRLRDLDKDTKWAIIPCCISCLIFAFSLAAILAQYSGIQRIVKPVIYLISSYALYRLTMLASDAAARKYPIAPNERRIKLAKKARRLFSLLAGILALSIGLLTYSIIRRILPFTF